MAISRPFLLALLGALLLGATFFAVQSARDQSAGDAAPAIQQASPQEAADPQPAVPAPGETLAAAFSNDRLQSASFDAKLAVHASGETDTVQLSGAFESEGPENMPKLALNLKTQGPRERGLNVGFVTTGAEAWFTEDGTGYAVPGDAWNQVVEARAESVGPQQQVPLPFNPEHWLRDAKSEGSESVGGVQSRHISARIDAATALRDLLDVAQQSGQAAPAILPEGAEQRIGDFVKRAELDAWVGDDDVLRRLTADLEIAVPGQGSIETELTVDLAKVGEPQQIVAPAKVARGLPDGRLGELANRFLTGAAVTAGADPTAVTAAASNSPRAFRRALDQKRKVVLFLSQGAADDRATASAVRAVERSSKRLLVLEDHVDNVDAYGKLVEQLNVYQAPAIVIVGRSGDARLIEGYVDTGVLRQEVADAR